MSIQFSSIYILFILFSILTGPIEAQHVLRGKVVDGDTNIGLPNVTIQDFETKCEVRTTTGGTFSIQVTSAFNRLTLIFFVKGYQTKTLKIIPGKNMLITLDPILNQLDQVIVNGITISQKLNQTPESVSILTESDINSENTVQLAPIFNRVPGLYMQSGSLNTNRITMRGIGARSPFSTANIRAYFADIPLTDGNGESAIEDMELGGISRIEIHKGPSSSSYGVGLGGAILLYPEFAKFQETSAHLLTTAGSFGLFKTVAKVMHGGQKSSINAVLGNTRSDGYRDNNSLEKTTAVVAFNWFLDAKNELTYIGNYTSLKAYIPSSLNKKDFDISPSTAATSWKNARGFEDFNKMLFGIHWSHHYNKIYTQKTSIFSNSNTNYEPRPFNILQEKTISYGMRTRLLATKNFENGSVQWSVGGELFFEDYGSKQFDNLYQNFPDGTGSVAGTILSDIDENRNYFNFFLEAVYTHKKLSANLGMHLNQTKYTVLDPLGGLSSKKDFTFGIISSPKIGINYTISNNSNWFASVSHGFSTPTTGETLLPEGVFNPDIKAMRGWNFEVGTRVHTTNKKVSGSVSVYHMRVSDVLINRRTATDQNITLNAGKTRHNGVEAALNWKVVEDASYSVVTYVNATINDIIFKDFQENGVNFSGNDLTGVPKSVVNLGVQSSDYRGLYGRLDFQLVGAIPANDENTLYSDAFELLNAKIGYRSRLGNHLSCDFFIGANNLLNTAYASQLQINAFGNDTNARYFYPGLPFNTYTGIQLKYEL